MDAVIVYRVEFCDGKGPWHSRECKVYVFPDYKVNPQPSPREDNIPGGIKRGLEFCACVSMTQLRSWFAHVWDELSSDGGRVVKYEVDGRRVRKGQWQCCVPVAHANRIGTMDLMED